MKTRSLIASDMDGVLVDTVGHLKKVGAEHGYRIEYSDHYSLDIYKDGEKVDYWDPDVTDLFNETFDRYDEIEIFPGAEEFIHKMYELTGQPFLIVTARPISHATETHKLIKRFAKKTPYVVAFADGCDKHRYLSGYKFFIEDRRRTAIDLVNMGKIVFLIDTVYNQPTEEMTSNKILMEEIIRIDSLEDLIPKAKYYSSHAGGTF